MEKALYLDPDTGDLALDPSAGGLALGTPDTSIASIVAISARGELKETPLIGGEALRQLGSPRQGLWLTRLRKMLAAAGLKVDGIEADSSRNTVQITFK